MHLSDLKPHTKRLSRKRVGRGGKRGTTSGHGTKGQKGRAGASVKPGFRGGDNRLWQLFPKQRGASKKHGNSKAHRKHRFFIYRQDKALELNLGALNDFADGQTIDPASLFDKGLVPYMHASVKILGGGALKRKLNFKDVAVSGPAAENPEKPGASNSEPGGRIILALRLSKL